MNRLFYPTVFHKAEESGYWVSFPDIPECFTQGETMEEAYKMARDALGLSLSDMADNKIELLKPIEIENIKTEENSFIL